ncbi:MAG: hypothetical protein IJZ85_00310 [Lachnospiraceae bacterium]|nr:hypothetical protein [Lachnospiraceae bacterium]
MKKNILKSMLSVLGAVLALCAVGMIALLVWSYKGNGITVGRCLVADNGSYLLIAGDSPINMSARGGNTEMFDKMETGDKILVVHDGIAESYPGKTGVYFCMRLGDGSMDDIPQTVIDGLTELGWLSWETIISGSDGIGGGERDGDESGNGGDDGSGLYLPKKDCDFSVQYIRTDGYHEDIDYPVVKIIRSADELSTYYEEYKDIYYLENPAKVYSDTTIGFLDACEKYDDAYFEQQILVFVLLEEGSGSIRHQVTDVRVIGNDGESEMEIAIKTIVPEVVTDDMAEWHLMIEPEAGVDVADESAVTVILDGKNVTDRKEYIEYSCNWVNMRLLKLEGWEYEIDEYAEDVYDFGISFWPKGQSEGKLKLHYYDVFGVCGTGLSSKEIVIGERTAHLGSYGGPVGWDFISFNDTPGSYVFMNEGASAWWDQYGDEALRIVESAVVAANLTGETEAIEIASQKCNVEYNQVRAYFDFDTGLWSVNFSKKNTAGGDQTVFVDTQGNITGIQYGE